MNLKHRDYCEWKKEKKTERREIVADIITD